MLAGESLVTIAEKFRLAKSSLSRHFRNHTLAASAKAVIATRPAVARRHPRTDSSEAVDVGEVLRELIGALRDLASTEADAGRSSSVAQLSQAILRGLEVIEKREERDAAKTSKAAPGHSELAQLFRDWPREALYAVAGRCPHCGDPLSCGRHGEIGREAAFEANMRGALEFREEHTA